MGETSGGVEPETVERWRDGPVTQTLGAVREWFERVFEPRTLKLFLLAAAALAIPVLDIGGAIPTEDVRLGSFDVERLIDGTFLVVGALLVLFAIGSGLLELRESPIRLAATHAVAAPSGPAANSAESSVESLIIGGDLVIGIDMARTEMSYGVLSIEHRPTTADASVLGSVRVREIVSTKIRRLRPGESRAEIYEGLVAAVVELLDELEALDESRSVAGIAVTTPSWIDIKSKSLVSPIGPLPVNEGLADGLARHLWHRHSERVRRVFGTPDHPVEREHDLAASIYLDTDSRSAARYDLHRRLGQGVAWENYACFIVLEGVGAGLILNGELYYGSHTSEGEVGHTTVHLSSEYKVAAAANGSVLVPDPCDCELPGIHWETIAGTNGLLRLASAIDEARIAELEQEYGRPIGYVDLIDVGEFARTGQPSPRLPVDVRRVVAADGMGYQRLSDSLFDEYARVLTIGLANTANVLDLEHTVLGGPILKELDRVLFRSRLRGCWGDYVLRGQYVGHSYASLKQLWQGAGLLFWDPTYRRRLR